VTSVLLVVLIAVTFHHMQLGMQVVIEDYVHVEWLKITSIVLVKFASVLLAVAAGFAVLKIAFAG
jgi:succinate dehydrogenase / fumarate reductase membrane anchor subunit